MGTISGNSIKCIKFVKYSSHEYIQSILGKISMENNLNFYSDL